MRIDPNGKVDGLHDLHMRRTSQPQENSVGKSEELKQDRVEISPAAKRDDLSAIRDEIVSEIEKGASPDRLRRLKAEIQSGKYDVDASDIADAIIDD